MNNAKKPQRAARALNGSARGMGVLRRASDSMAVRFASEIKYRRGLIPVVHTPRLARANTARGRSARTALIIVVWTARG